MNRTPTSDAALTTDQATSARPPYITYVRVPPAAHGHEQPICITAAAFDAELRRDRFARDRYEYRMPGVSARTVDDERFHDHRRRGTLTKPADHIAAAIAATQGELAPVLRLLENVAVGLDQAALLAEAIAGLQAAADHLRPVLRNHIPL